MGRNLKKNIYIYIYSKINIRHKSDSTTIVSIRPIEKHKFRVFANGATLSTVSNGLPSTAHSCYNNGFGSPNSDVPFNITNNQYNEPYSRFEIWNLLQSLQHGHVIYFSLLKMKYVFTNQHVLFFFFFFLQVCHTDMLAKQIFKSLNINTSK